MIAPKIQKPLRIAYICPNLIGDYYQTQWMALYQWSSSHNVSLMIFSPYLHYIKPELAGRYRRNFKLAQEASLDGVVINDASLNVFFTETEIKELLDGFGNIPIITLSSSYSDFPSVVADNKSGFQAIMDHLVVHHGYKRLAFIKGIEGNAEATMRLEIFVNSLREKGLKVDESLIMQGNFVFDSGRQAALTLCDHPEGLPEAIVCANDEMAMGALDGLKFKGVQVPSDVTITGFDDIESGLRHNPALTTVTQEVVNQVYLAMERLVSAIHKGQDRIDDGPAHRVVPTTATLRDSCGCKRSPTGPILSRDNQFLQQSQYLINNRGCEIGEIANFSKIIMGALSLTGLREELTKLARILKLDTLQAILYQQPLGPDKEDIPAKSQVLFDLDYSRGLGSEPLTQAPIGSLSVLKDKAANLAPNQTLVISEMVFSNSYYGYIIAGREDPEPLVFQMINLELTNCLYTIFLNNRMDAANQKLRTFDSLKNDFIANITHDFRSPLSITLGTSELALLDLTPDDPHYERYNVIKEASFKLKDIIDRFLELSRMDERGVVLRVQNIEIEPYLQTFVDFYRSSLLNSSISIELETPAQPLSDFYTDPEKLDQILSNIVSNALKFVDPDHGRIVIRLSEQEARLTIEIVDNGIGIPKDKLEEIFERFTQLGDTRTAKFRGTGIGLAFSRTLATHLKGEIRADSLGEGKGSTFTLTLPKGKQHFSEADLILGENMSKGPDYDRQKTKDEVDSQVQELLPRNMVIELPPDETRVSEIGRIEDALILIIEDNSSILKLEEECLRKAGYRYFVLASNGAQGLAAARKYRPDLILCDINVPGIPGDQIYKSLIEDPAFNRTPFVFVSAIADRDFIHHLRDRGAEAFLTKPIDTEELILTVNYHLRSLIGRRQEIWQAQLDELTGLTNRKNFLLQCQAQFQCRRLRDFSFIFLDVDHFKHINDGYGHHTGDAVLRAVARELKSNLRPYDLVGRYGGEEFVVLLPDTGLESAKIVAEKLRALISRVKLTFGKKELQVTASLGISSLRDHEARLPAPQSAPDWPSVLEPYSDKVANWDVWKADINTSIDSLIEMADKGMYRAKEKGRNRVEVF